MLLDPRDDDMRNIHLTDIQYLRLLKVGRQHLNTVQKVSGYDCTAIGDKDTQTNVGLCNRDLTWREIALFPSRLPERKSMKYRKHHHKCPLDNRPVSREIRSGCFYTCMFFQDGLTEQEKIKALYDAEIDRVERELKGNSSNEHNPNSKH